MAAKTLTLSTKITIFSSVATFISICAISIIFFTQTKEAYFEKKSSSLKNDAAILESYLSTKIENHSANIRAIVDMPPIPALISLAQQKSSPEVKNEQLVWEQRLTKILSSILDNNRALFQARLIAPTGKEIIKIVKSHSGKNIVVDKSILQDKSQRDYIIEAKQFSPGSLYYSSISYNIENGKIEIPKRITMRVVKPIYTKQGSLFAYIVFNIDVEKMLGDVVRHFANKYTLVLSDIRGNILTYVPDTNNIKLTSHRQADIEHILQTENALYNDYLVEKYKISPSPINSGTVLSFAIAAKKDWLLKLNESRFITVVSTLLLVLCIYILISYIANKFFLNKLLSLARAIKPSNTSTVELKPFIQDTDEVGIIARAFDAKTRM